MNTDPVTGEHCEWYDGKARGECKACGVYGDIHARSRCCRTCQDARDAAAATPVFDESACFLSSSGAFLREAAEGNSVEQHDVVVTSGHTFDRFSGLHYRRPDDSFHDLVHTIHARGFHAPQSKITRGFTQGRRHD